MAKMRPEILEIYIDIVTMLEGRIENYSILAERINYHFKVNITAEDLERFYDVDLQDIRLTAKNLGINY